LEASKRFVVTGNSRLTVAVARQLSARGGHVTVVDVGGEGTIARRLQADVRPRRRLSLRALLGAAEGRFEPGIHVASAGEDLQASLQAVALAGATCLLALSDHDEENLLVGLAGSEVAPSVPLVLQTFDPALADQLEQVEREVTVRRAYSVGGLAAPFFVALALGHENIRTMRFGDVELPILRMKIGPGSGLAGKTARRIREQYGCEVVAAHRERDGWRIAAEDDGPYAAGETLVIGGPRIEVFTLARECSPAEDRSGADGSSRRRFLHRRGARRQRLRVARGQFRRASLLFPTIPLVLAAVLLGSVAIVAGLHHFGLVDGFYFFVRTLLGETGPEADETLHKALVAIGLLVGWALAGLLISFLAALFVVERVEESMTFRAQRRTGHIVIAGLGNVGFRVWELLHDVRVPCAVIDPSPEDRFLEAVGQHDPVLAGGIGLTETLERANVGKAVSLIACSENNVSNVEACMRSSRMNPRLRTIARIFDDPLAERAAGAFQIDHVLAAVEVAASAFVDAATDPLALRPFQLGDCEFKGLRRNMVESVDPAEIRSRGLRILAFRKRGEDRVQGPSAPTEPFGERDGVVVVGLAEAIDSFIADTSPGSPAQEGAGRAGSRSSTDASARATSRATSRSG